MFICMVQPLEQFIEDKSWKYDAIVVEGYDGVGKGRVLNTISNIIGVVPYRPDYNLWQQYDHRPQDRWKVSGFFWDVLSHFGKHPSVPFLFDRGVISGAVYNNDDRIARDYKSILRDMRVLHILVTCSEDDYNKFNKLRNSDTELDYSKCREYTQKYIEYLEMSGVEYTEYVNKYDESIAEESLSMCVGCGHYSYGYCRHPKRNFKVNWYDKRCELSVEMEVQDNVTEMQCV